MKKTKINFSDKQLLKVFLTFGKNFYVRVNKCGNIELIDPKKKNPLDKFVLYLTPNKNYLWRHKINCNYVYVLNMINRTCQPWYTKYAEFKNLDDAIKYFKNYAKTYLDINI